MSDELHRGAVEVYGETMMSWGRAEFCMKRIILFFSTDEKIRERLEDSQKNDPNTWDLIEEMKKCAREAYGRFILDARGGLEALEEFNMEKPGVYSQRGFDEFIKALHAARESRNSLVHDVAQKEMEHLAEARGEPSHVAKLAKAAQETFDDIGVCMLSISKVSPPMCFFAVWAQVQENKKKAGKA